MPPPSLTTSYQAICGAERVAFLPHIRKGTQPPTVVCKMEAQLEHVHVA